MKFLSDNYRFMTLTSTTEKKHCKTVISKRLNQYLEDSDLICRQQAGFGSQASTIDQLMRISTDTEFAFNKGFKAAVVFMDLTKAFDTLLHDGLIYKLYSLNLPTSIIRWIIKFLTNKTTKLRLEDEYSTGITIQRGVYIKRSINNVRLNY